MTAAPITWQAAGDTVNPSDVLTSGALVEAINCSPTSAGNVTVNGVDFSPSDALLSNDALSGFLNGGETLDPGLDALLNTLDFGGGTSTSITVGGGSLVAGQSYALQVFFTDLRNSTSSSRVMTFGDSEGNAVDVVASGAPGSFGQNATGTFVADGTNQTLSLTTNGFGNAHITAYQIRTTTLIPTIDSFNATPTLISNGEHKHTQLADQRRRQRPDRQRDWFYQCGIRQHFSQPDNDDHLHPHRLQRRRVGHLRSHDRRRRIDARSCDHRVPRQQ